MLTGLQLMFMGVTRSKSGLFSTPRLLSHLWEKEEGGGKKKGTREKGNGKGEEGTKKV